MDIWRFNDTVTGRLLTWNLANIELGWRLRTRHGFWKEFGTQALGWGLINIGIAVIGRIITRQRRDTMDDPYAPEVVRKETRNLRRLLWINSGLDVLYVLGGLTLARRSMGKPQRRGTGGGIAFQGMLLFVFDLIHARILTDKPTASIETGTA